MSHLSNGIFAAIAASATLGAVHLASGHDLSGLRKDADQDAATAVVNRTAKTDRAVVAVVAPNATRTISLRVHGLDNSSIVLRMPIQAPDAGRSTARPVARSGGQRAMVACEPVVSVLTDVVRELQPGRCVT